MAAGKISEVAARDVSSQGGSNFMLGCERVAQLMSDSQMHVWALITDCRPRLSPGPLKPTDWNSRNTTSDGEECYKGTAV